ncbi:MAG: hypothetical protein H6623_08025 [Bdellovibrionaceae bacterium]|nr:hypothetical protein [Pseudobdellovibrionaceae bacterium]
MRKTLAFCILIAISIRTNAGIQAIYDSWKTSKISFNTSDTYFNDTKCFKVGDMLTLSCIEGYNMAGTLSSPERILVTNDYFKKYSEYYQSVKNYGSLILVKKISPIPAQTLRDSLALKQELRASLTAISKEIVESQKNIELAPFSFTQLIKDLRSSTPEHIPTQMIVRYSYHRTTSNSRSPCLFTTLIGRQ